MEPQGNSASTALPRRAAAAQWACSVRASTDCREVARRMAFTRPEPGLGQRGCTEPHPATAFTALLPTPLAAHLAYTAPEGPTASTAPRQTLDSTASPPPPVATQLVCSVVGLMACRAAAAPMAFTAPHRRQVRRVCTEPPRSLDSTA